MKKTIALLFFSLIFLCLSAQEKDKMSNLLFPMKNINGKTMLTKFDNKGEPFLLVLCATWDPNSSRLLKTLSGNYDELVEMTGLKIYAIFIDNEKNAPKIKPLVEDKKWQFEVYNDYNNELNRFLKVNSTVPHVFLYDGNSKLVYEKKGFLDGYEEELYDKLFEIKGIKDYKIINHYDDEIKLTPNDSIKSGEDPFDIFFKNN